MILVALVSAVIAGCSTPVSKPVESPADHSQPTAHVWQYMYSHDLEDIGYATYSYVLVGRDESYREATSRYFELVRAIQGSTARAESIPDNVSKARFNLFVIPAVGNKESATHEPNYEVSKLLLALLSTMSPVKFDNPGPYIITLPKPISMGEKNEVADIFYIDLTNMHRTAIQEVVRSYKEELFEKNLNGVEKLKSLRLSVLNIALVTEDSIGFARAAYADLLETFLE